MAGQDQLSHTAALTLEDGRVERDAEAKRAAANSRPAGAGRPGWLFLSVWTLLSALAPVAALAVSFPMFRVLIEALGPTVVRYGYSSPTEDALGLFVFYPALGVILGGVEALLLRRYVAGAWRWLLAITAGWTAVLVFSDLTVAIVRLTEIELSPAVRMWVPLFMLGLISGGLQWLFFQRTIQGAAWFLPAALLGAVWIPASREYLGGISYLGQFIGTTAAPGLVSGLAVVLLLRNRPGKMERAAI